MTGQKPEGLRERKKRATYDAIAATARRLFAAHGFDAVTVAEIAVAAGVSEKTVFNHFATKEDLVFAGGDTRLAQLRRDIAQRPPGTAVLDVFRANSEEMLDDVAAGESEDSLVVPRIVRGSPALQERLAVGWEREAAALVAVFAEATGADDDDLVPAVVARTLASALITIFRVVFAGLLAGEDPQQLAARLRPQVARAYDQLAAGLGDYAVAGPAADSAP
ncbi:helix-turn-helix domain-containing protein [Conexibacter stalactiti]|uniref:Helix-turn-helix domain-containing protein n=1 Tax=Conexibacter stalactiti TaxID=1940611 RepID=A0ABU4I0Y0_9ACTN|nr:helix-turn-helix domain-containing protein [Conexibacter stalactiti]MDW5598612.1 helix-turn-helix domain-containing protein [Conexibacter stalactiti]MEC5039254.1 helix-turn-helix domain-containing protein [Conexibacter stalactiti]